jgi:hypothetical protein
MKIHFQAEMCLKTKIFSATEDTSANHYVETDLSFCLVTARRKLSISSLTPVSADVCNMKSVKPVPIFVRILPPTKEYRLN